MNPYRRPSRSLAHSQPIGLALLIALMGLVGMIQPSSAIPIDDDLTKAIWKMKYLVSDAQLNETGIYAGWQSRDDDGDGNNNGAELGLGTDPFTAGVTLKVTTLNITATDVSVTFPTVAGSSKKYVLQKATNVTTWVDVSPVQEVVGDGTSKTLTTARAGNPGPFYRVLVRDIDTDADGVADWTEVTTGPTTSGGYDKNDPTTYGTDDHDSLTDAVATSNLVTVTVNKANATQPVDAVTAPVEVGTITVSRGGPLRFNEIVVPLQKSGTAVAGTDYESSDVPLSVTFAATTGPAVGGVSDIVLTIRPKYNSSRKTNVTAIVKALPGGGYSLGAASSGGVVINPNGLAIGTGLTGHYYNSASANYSTQTTIFGGAESMTQVDPVIDFANRIASISTGNPCTVTTERPHQIPVAGTATVVISGVSGGTFAPTINGTFTATYASPNTFTVPSNCTVVPSSVSASLLGGTNGWNTVSGPVGMSPASGTGVFSVRWIGKVLPQYSETYSFDFRSKEGGKVWVNGQLLIDKWSTQAVTENINTIALTAGLLYDIKIEYFCSGTSTAPEARLYWWSPSRPKQIIPMGRLFPEGTQADKLTPVTSSLAAVGYEGEPFSFSVTTPDIDGATTYALATDSGLLPPALPGLPTRLSLDSGTGIISGTPSTAGTYNVVVNATNVAAGTVTGSSVVNITIFPAGGVTREILATTGSGVSQIVIPTGDPGHTTIATIDDNTDRSNNTGVRLRGYLVPPKTGNYYFWIAANNAAELWISNDHEYVNRVRRASVTATTGYKTWNALDYDHDSNVNTPPLRPQMSPWLSLVAGEKYYFEVLHNTGSDTDDHVAVGWCQDDIGTVPATATSPNPTGVLTSIPNGGGGLQGYPFSGTVAGFACQPYDYPTVTPPTGTLYASNLGPQATALTSASGSVSLQVNSAKTQGILHFDYQNLTSPRTAYHLHVDGYTSSVALGSTVHPAGEIVFDIDDADVNPSLQTADGGYIWDFATTTGSFLSVAQVVEAIETGKVYLNVHSVSYPAGEIRGTLALIDGSQTPPDPAAYVEPTVTDSPSSTENAARFLNQATFGASPLSVAAVAAAGSFGSWVDTQIALPTNTRTSGDVVAGITSDVNQPYPSSLFTNTWWKNSITAPDQLRQRLAFALSEIMVVSYANDTGPLAYNGRILADYYDQLVDYCLPTAGLADSGNFRGILRAISLTPAMGRYLDMLGNQKGDLTIGRSPNENYAREIMQLFSIGIYRQWDDGRFVLGSNAGLVATYTQPTIVGLANLLTGWTYAQANQANGRAPTSFGPAADYLNSMVLVPNYHELGRKLLLNRVVSPEATGRTPRVGILTVAAGSPACTVTTSSIHGLKTGDTVLLSGIGAPGVFTGGLTAINTSFQATVTSPTTFTVPVECTTPVSNQGTVTGATVRVPAYTAPSAPLAIGVPAIPGSQADNSGIGASHPFDQYGLRELDMAIDNIVNNDNVPPFICRQLIQRLVTSDPSPGYVYRVVQKFKNNGSGVRGDLAAVVKQILTDGEARRSTTAQASTSFGKQREPVMRLTGAARAFPALAYTGTYTQLTGTDSNLLRLTTSTPNDFNAGFTVALNFRGNYTNPPAGQTVDPYTNPTTTSYSIGTTTAIANATTDISSIPVSTPCRVNTVQPHGLTTGATVIINGVTGGTFSASITTARTITVVDADTFDLTGVNCTVLPSSVASAKMISTPCKITTQYPHGLTTGDSVTISGVSGGTFAPAGAINGSYTVTVVDSTSFLPLSPTFGCTAPPTANTGSIVGANTMQVTATGMVKANYDQLAGSATMTVSTSGPQTNIVVPGTGGATIIKSKVYLSVLSRTSALPLTSIIVSNPCQITKVGHGLSSGNTVTISGVTGGTFSPGINGTYTVTVLDADRFTVPSNCTVVPTSMTSALATGSFGSTAANNVYEVQATPTGSTFTVFTADTPTARRTGSVLIPKITSSYVTATSGTVASYSTNVNHNLSSTAPTQIWVDAPVNTGVPVADAEYTVPATTATLGVTDEDHFKTSYQPTSANGGSYPVLSGGNNGIVIWPLVPAPTGRSGVVSINQSTFVVNSTESTLTQTPLNAPTVFNFFLPDYKFPGTLANSGLDSPEFQLSTDTNLTNLTNSLTNMFIGTGGGNSNLNGLNSFNNGGGAVVMDIGPYMTLAKTSNAGVPALIDELANLLVGAPLLASTKTAITTCVANSTNFPYTTPTPTNLQMRDRVRAIIHLIITSAEYAVQK